MTREEGSCWFTYLRFLLCRPQAEPFIRIPDDDMAPFMLFMLFSLLCFYAMFEGVGGTA